MRRLFAAFVITALALPTFSSAAPRGQVQPGTASLAGTATSNTGQALANYTVQLRNLGSGTISSTTTSGATGGFSFSGLPAGQYAVEVVNANGVIVGTSAAVNVAAGATITGVAVSASAAAAAGTAGAAGAAAAAGAGGGLSTAAIVTIVTIAAAGGIAAAVAIANNDSSPSR